MLTLVHDALDGLSNSRAVLGYRDRLYDDESADKIETPAFQQALSAFQAAAPINELLSEEELRPCRYRSFAPKTYLGFRQDHLVDYVNHTVSRLNIGAHNGSSINLHTIPSGYSCRVTVEHLNG